MTNLTQLTDWHTQYGLDFDDGINVDLFSGGGGASTGIEMGLKRPVHIAINHDADAISMHQANHPHAEHHLSDVYEVDPKAAVRGRRVNHLHASPDCTHHSQARGGQSRKRAIRSLSWVVHKWAGTVRPATITLENVEQILQWSPLVAKRDKATGRVVTLDVITCPDTGRKINRVADRGERVPVERQFLVPDKRRKGRNWKHFVDGLRSMGYAVQWRTMKACDYGAPTTRARLYMIARCDGVPITWPTPSHAAKPKRGQQRHRAAHECIDWSIPARSIFDRPKPLAAATMRRIAKGIDRFVLGAADPFIVPIANYGGSGDQVQSIREPLRTVTAWPKGGSFAVAAPTLVQTGYGERAGQAPRSLDLDQPLGTVVAGGVKHALATAFMAQMNGGFNETPGHDLRRPTSTVTNKGSQQQLVTAHLMTHRRHSTGTAASEPLATITAGGEHHSLVECTLSPEHEAGALRVAAFLMHYYSTGGQWGALDKPMAAITTKDRLALVTVWVKGTPYVIVDICLRMLVPRELYRAQGLPDSYIIEHGHDGRRFSKSKQVKFCGNSVSPLPMAAIYRELNRPERLAQGVA
ncbi:DNA cytosine methyltransferase [Salinicola endophyticus]|uniref:DNA (cytosine-5-)-methyltransferase n=1 Tax=Salinicola endophyticus TaxID=1949083 RepID=A0ABY8FC99_9GAMM|nr:DNA cytosine methyltransferase [Salinicola endophyticus]WFF40426.1 DNA cytosine methyltransferase [Salinicola endophyticus]